MLKQCNSTPVHVSLLVMTRGAIQRHTTEKKKRYRVFASVKQFKSGGGRDKENEQRLGITPFEDSRIRMPKRLYEVTSPASDIGIEFKEIPGARYKCMVSKVPEKLKGVVREGDLLTRVTATRIHEQVRTNQATTIFDDWGWTSEWFDCRDESFDDVLAAINSTAVVSAGFRHKTVTFEFKTDDDDNDENDDNNEEKEEEEGEEEEKKDGLYLRDISLRGKLQVDREINLFEPPLPGVKGRRLDNDNALFFDDPPAWDD